MASPRRFFFYLGGYLTKGAAGVNGGQRRLAGYRAALAVAAQPLAPPRTKALRAFA